MSQMTAEVTRADDPDCPAQSPSEQLLRLLRKDRMYLGVSFSLTPHFFSSSFCVSVVLSVCSTQSLPAPQASYISAIGKYIAENSKYDLPLSYHFDGDVCLKARNVGYALMHWKHRSPGSACNSRAGRPAGCCRGGDVTAGGYASGKETIPYLGSRTDCIEMAIRPPLCLFVTIVSNLPKAAIRRVAVTPPGRS